MGRSDNPSFVLRAIEHVAYEQRPIPESRFKLSLVSYQSQSWTVSDDDVLVEVKKTGG
jgi:D-xylulose reductase